MWTANRAPARPQRTGSVHSIASVHSAHSRPSSVVSPHYQLSRQQSRSGYESDQSSDTLNEEDFNAPMPAMWQTKRQESGSAVSRLSQKFATAIGTSPVVTPLKPSPTLHKSDIMRMEFDDDARSRASTTSTLNGDEHDFEFPEKTPTNKMFGAGDRSIPYYTGVEPKPYTRKLKIIEESSSATDKNIPYYTGIEPAPLSPLKNIIERPSAAPASRRAMGPLESQLAALMDKVSQIESNNPIASVTPADYATMKARLETLEAEKKTWQKRHEAIWALRDEDVENNIKIRGVLAKTRRSLEAMTALRDEDLANVQAVRLKLAEATKQVDRLRSQGPPASGRASPNRGGRPPSMFLERRDTTDLFAAAKAAALEQRALEMEKRNSDLRAQIETLKGGANIDDLNRMTAHEAWKDEISSMASKLKVKDAEIAELRAAKAASAPSAPSGAPSTTAGHVAWHRVEAIHEEHASYRERMGGKLAVLRSEKEGLQKELHRREDECHALEVKVQSLQRRANI
ncbi:uncharacterized protein N0V89_003199 [Didymosphaeria variabile]|uniref:Uncharacterized protein n=1 Tax=Didymosphaeria variabile TaxID=1932322 RepID=A0A9W8XT33_9PLEO|nr:uncharacterized protein N0V89_003199 [Didymosphaeria variabile]KAJ4358615.1 hypothetical protein N0V89_003199 [Didymosphaeria variabile]